MMSVHLSPPFLQHSLDSVLQLAPFWTNSLQIAQYCALESSSVLTEVWQLHLETKWVCSTSYHRDSSRFVAWFIHYKYKQHSLSYANFGLQVDACSIDWASSCTMDLQTILWSYFDLHLICNWLLTIEAFYWQPRGVCSSFAIAADSLSFVNQLKCYLAQQQLPKSCSS